MGQTDNSGSQCKGTARGLTGLISKRTRILRAGFTRTNDCGKQFREALFKETLLGRCRAKFSTQSSDEQFFPPYQKTSKEKIKDTWMFRCLFAPRYQAVRHTNDSNYRER